MSQLFTKTNINKSTHFQRGFSFSSRCDSLYERDLTATGVGTDDDHDYVYVHMDSKVYIMLICVVIVVDVPLWKKLL